MSISKIITWSIRKFPENVKNKFLGYCKTNGKKAPRLLANILTDFLRSQDKPKSS